LFIFAASLVNKDEYIVAVTHCARSQSVHCRVS